MKNNYISKILVISLACLIGVLSLTQKLEASPSLVDLASSGGGIVPPTDQSSVRAFPELSAEAAVFLGLTEQSWKEYNSQRFELYDFYEKIFAKANSVFGISEIDKKEYDLLYQTKFMEGTRQAIKAMLERELN
ncbi:MAG: hypothetical protein SGJ18_16500 [Pseudomonadota bacterium]|nr:hypothetical protein [Pseudomonadota bacterium]